jgi:hypothetical protein
MISAAAAAQKPDCISAASRHSPRDRPGSSRQAAVGTEDRVLGFEACWVLELVSRTLLEGRRSALAGMSPKAAYAIRCPRGEAALIIRR